MAKQSAMLKRFIETHIAQAEDRYERRLTRLNSALQVRAVLQAKQWLCGKLTKAEMEILQRMEHLSKHHFPKCDKGEVGPALHRHKPYRKYQPRTSLIDNPTPTTRFTERLKDLHSDPRAQLKAELKVEHRKLLRELERLERRQKGRDE